jgi:hypothetical protein
MKKIVSLVVLGLVAASLASGPAAGAKKKKKYTQKVSGNILMQAPPSDATDNPNGCYSGVHRRINVLAQENVNGVVGYHFDVDKKTWGGKFKLVPQTEGVDIDITFYAEFGTVEQAAETSYAPYTVGFEKRNTSGEKGVVPKDVTKAIVCMKTGQNADFSYTATK